MRAEDTYWTLCQGLDSLQQLGSRCANKRVRLTINRVVSRK